MEFHSKYDSRQRKILQKGLVVCLDEIFGSTVNSKGYKELGAVIFFEPSNMKDTKAFDECVKVADVIKFSDERISN